MLGELVNLGRIAFTQAAVHTDDAAIVARTVAGMMDAPTPTLAAFRGLMGLGEKFLGGSAVKESASGFADHLTEIGNVVV